MFGFSETIRTWPTLVPTGTSLPTQNSYGALTKSGLTISGKPSNNDDQDIYTTVRYASNNYNIIAPVLARKTVEHAPSASTAIETTASEYFMSLGSTAWSEAFTMIVCLPAVSGVSLANTSPVSGLMANTSESLFGEYEILYTTRPLSPSSGSTASTCQTRAKEAI